MSERIEQVVTVRQSSVITAAMSSRLERMLELGAEVARKKSCGDCTNLALCGIAIHILSKKNLGTHSLGEVTIHGVEISDDEEVCPGKLVEEALRRNETNDFWLLEADELSQAHLQVRTAQTVHHAAEYVRTVIDKKIIT